MDAQLNPNLAARRHRWTLIWQVLVHLEAETFFGLADLALGGWGCDNLREGCIERTRTQPYPSKA